MRGKDLIVATLFGGGGSSGGGIPQADIDAAFAALAEKGVTVPDGATSADLDDLIASIVTGGGGNVRMASGTFRVAENTDITGKTYYSVSHGLGETPRLAVVLTNTSYPTASDYYLINCIVYENPEYPGYYRLNASIGSSKVYNHHYLSGSLLPNENTFTIGALHSTTKTVLNSAYEYIWYAFAWGDV